MDKRTFGNTDIQVTPVGLGTWAIGGWMWGGTDEAQSIDTIHRAIDKGIGLVDTAPVYGFGRSEEIVGKALSDGRRDQVALATKVALNWNDDHDKVWRDASASRIEREVEDSLKRLQTDRIDIYQVHWPDPKTPMEETARALEKLYQAGKIRAIGVSNFTPSQMDELQKSVPLHSLQPPYNLFEREIEQDILPYCRENGIATITYGGLCRGFLTGKMREDTQFTGDDLRKNDPKFQGDRYRQYLNAVAELDAFARERYQKSVLALALRWLVDQPGVTTALWGARRPEQLDPVDEIDGWSLDKNAMAEIDGILDRCITDPVGPEFMAPPTR
ncbi:aldo/keto reductase [Marinobacter adhaerens]|jgi:aryl-alcohol dehydrogenase-like predicted oxidoreductase|uniref:Aldo/keto reductase n=2 Tax=Marinobacter adhaerens TaxID=1033846 RepID=A0ABX8IFJ0_9GAMM|nr:aldo/keto reductase [Marinobacter adhaerens]MCR9187382.1 aldo/keto reductase [Alteromonadaceae bacterium]ADP98591.1 oxidoreductase, aldo/keto reductase family [Marinobacter adhaerens HP15]MBW3226426.1 aldo/keto reductase [Marinobacter adhaerens]MBW4976902.1 aldo/keto reductase [Marinobacter adhaerens]QWV12582.1 aldo/keto reductase [Marinobacter adhaerens]